MPTPPVRVFVIFASKAKSATILSKGPAAWYHVTHWDTEHDTFEQGAWIKGRIYPEKCDVSPDRKLLLYFVHQGSRIGTTYTDAYTALSRTPWLAAIGLWPNGTTYGGGGRFVEDRHIVLRSGSEAHPDHLCVAMQVSCGAAACHASANIYPNSDWSGIDQAGRIIFARAGKLYSLSKTSSKEIELIDLNVGTPVPQPAPRWAIQPISAPKKGRKV